ncbi:MAG: ABC-2 family transporter protein [Oscillospiraceae bacterium]|jgi:ABC-2 type transport system permease protein|nr:ABC-2 family transporter protein [Oscillospiraceae bacterium]
MIYFKYLRMVIRSFMQYRLSFWLNLLGQFFVTFFAFAGMALLFRRFGSIGGWSFGEAALCFAVVGTSFALTECFARGFDIFQRQIKSGDFDRLLLRPRGTVLQVMGSNFELTRAGRLAQSLVVLGLAVSWVDVTWTAAKILTLVLMILSGVAVFTGVFILGAVVCFWTVEGLEFINIFTDGGREIAAYPLTIYPKWIMRFFTFLLPFGCFNYLPLLYLTGRAAAHPTLYMLTPLLGFVYLLPCLLLWRFGVRHYISTGN